MRKPTLRPFIIGLVACGAWAALPTFRGDEELDWVDGTSVILADVKGVARIDEAGYRYRAALVPRSTLSGTFDCGLHPELTDTNFYVGPVGSSVEQVPKAGSTVMSVVRPVNGKWGVPIDACAFMPEGSALVVVDGSGDPKVFETLKKIQAARAKGRAEEKAEAEKKARDAAHRE